MFAYASCKSDATSAKTAEINQNPQCHQHTLPPSSASRAAASHSEPLKVLNPQARLALVAWPLVRVERLGCDLCESSCLFGG